MAQTTPNPYKKPALISKTAVLHPEKAAVGGVYDLQDTFHITRESLNKIITHCRQELPFEACGLISGRNGIAYRIWKMTNIDRSPYSFSMDLDELKHVFLKMTKYNQEFMGIYHSHPSGIAYPSPEDIHFNNYPDKIQFIISLAERKPVIKAFRYYGNNVIPYKINVTEH